MLSRRFELTAGIESKAAQFAETVERDGCDQAVLTAVHGAPTSIALVKDGAMKYYTLVDGEWCEHVREGGAR